MKVKLLYYTPIEIAYYSAKTCYSKDSAINMITPSKEEIIEFLKNILKTQHYSTVEGINFTFAIEDVSRALMAQLTRHRTGIQFSIQSQRYVKLDKAKFYEPVSILKSREADAIYNNCLGNIQNVYNKLIDLGIKAEDARYILPNATFTNITTTINLRELIHIMGLRKCNRAQKEIRDLMNLMSKEILEKEPWLSDYLQPKCETLKICTEHHGCGRKKSLVEMIKDRQNEEK